MLTLLKLNHKKGDKTTLDFFSVAMAFGIDTGFFSGESDQKLIKLVKKEAEKNGIDFTIGYLKKPLEWLKNNKEKEIINFGRHGMELRNFMHRLKESKRNKVLIVGDEKIPGDIFALSDWNFSINKTFPEPIILTIFLYEFYLRD